LSTTFDGCIGSSGFFSSYPDYLWVNQGTYPPTTSKGINMSALISFQHVIHSLEGGVVDLACFKYEFMELNHIHLAVVDSSDYYDVIQMSAAQTGGTWKVDYSIPVWYIDWPLYNIKPVQNAKDVAIAEFKALKRVIRDQQTHLDIVQRDACGTESGKIEKSLAHLMYNQGESLWSPERGDGWGIVGQ